MPEHVRVSTPASLVMSEQNPNKEAQLSVEGLSPCPFCGKSVAVVVSAAEMWPDDPEASDSSLAVFCDAQKPRGPGGCGASGGFFPSRDEAVAAWNRRAALSRQEPAAQGWQLVPKEPTQEMLAAGEPHMDGMSHLGDAWEAMLAASPVLDTSEAGENQRSPASLVMNEQGKDGVLVRLKRPEGYEDVHPELILADANIHPAFEPELVQGKDGGKEVWVNWKLPQIEAGAAGGKEDQRG